MSPTLPASEAPLYISGANGVCRVPLSTIANHDRSANRDVDFESEPVEQLDHRIQRRVGLPSLQRGDHLARDSRAIAQLGLAHTHPFTAFPHDRGDPEADADALAASTISSHSPD